MTDLVMTDRATTDHRLSQISTASSTNSKRAKAHIGPWQLGRTLGSGSSGRVRLAKHMETGKLAAVKIVPKAQSNEQSGVPKASESYGIEREVIIMKLIEHPNVMALYDVWENKGELYLVLEYIEGGELFDYLICRGRLSEREAVHYFRQICYGVDYCHRFNICHRDLKPENLLLDKNRNIKIADFGMAALEANGRLLETSCGSPHYASPEIVTGKTYHGAPSDIWSCGIILFALLTGHLPFDDDNIRQLLLKVQAGKFSIPPSISLEARDLISRMLVVDPMERICMQDILNHQLLKKYPPRYVPPENSGKKQPQVDVRQPINNIDLEILKNLQTLWHYGSTESLIMKLKEPSPNIEKTFYSLLLKFRQRHGPGSRESFPRNKSVASVRSLRSSKSVRSIASLNSKHGSVKSLKSIRSHKSSKSIKSNRRPVRKSPTKQTDVLNNNSSNKTTSATNGHHVDVFAQILDQAFNSSRSSVESRAAGTNRSVANSQDLKVSAPYSGKTNISSNLLRRRQTLGSTEPTGPSSVIDKKDAADLSRPMTSTGPSTEQSLLSGQETFNVDFDFSDRSLTAVCSTEHSYLLPMIFEEDRFADAIEEEMELKVYKRNDPSHNDNGHNRNLLEPSSNDSQASKSHQATGESLLSYHPSPAAASVAAPVRQAPRAPRAPSGPRAMPAGRKPVPIYVDSETSTEASNKSLRPDIPKGRVPLGTLTDDELKSSSRRKNSFNNGAKSLANSNESDSLKVSKRGERRQTSDDPNSPTIKDKRKFSWIRKLTPRLMSRKGSKPDPIRDEDQACDEDKASFNIRTSTKCSQDVEYVPSVKPITRMADKLTRQSQTLVNKENILPLSGGKPISRNNVIYDKQRQVSRGSNSSMGEPRQNWLMKILTSATFSSSRTLVSPCQPIELRAIILEILNEWRPHGLALYSDGSRGDPIVAALLPKNSLRLKSARVEIEIKTFNNNSSYIKLINQKGSRSSFVTFANEMERRLGEINVLS